MKSYVTIAVNVPIEGEVDWDRADRIAARLQDHLRSTGYYEVNARASLFYVSQGDDVDMELRAEDPVNQTVRP